MKIIKILSEEEGDPNKTVQDNWRVGPHQKQKVAMT